MMTFALFFILFWVAVGIGYIMDGVKKDCISYQETNESFVIHYNNRRIIVSGNNKTRLCAYKWKGKIETITFPITSHTDPIQQIEHFISRYKTSRLTKYLFDFSNMKDPANLLAFDPNNGKLLSEIQLKLKAYIRNAQ